MSSEPARSSAAFESLRVRLAALIEQSPRSGPMVIASVVGFVTGVGAVVFLWLIGVVEWLILDQLFGRALADMPGWLILFAPALGGLLVAPIVMRLAPETRGGGVPEVIMAVEVDRARIRPRVGPLKALASALTLGSGGSGGTEGSIVQIGSTFGSTVGQWLRLSDENTRLLLASGAAAGVAAVFNAPIAGVFFALEVILRRFSTRNFSVVVLASVVGTTTAVTFRGDDPVLLVPAYGLGHPSEILLYALLGALCAGAAVLFTRVLYAVDVAARRQRTVPPLLMPAAGGLVVGVLGLWHSGALGLGDAATDAALMGDMGVQTMVLLFGLKMATTVTTLA
ncbi:MAG: chloride channel protein, partial [Dehalococcoidia bacterium]